MDERPVFNYLVIIISRKPSGWYITKTLLPFYEDILRLSFHAKTRSGIYYITIQREGDNSQGRRVALLFLIREVGGVIFINAKGGVLSHNARERRGNNHKGGGRRTCAPSDNFTPLAYRQHLH